MVLVVHIGMRSRTKLSKSSLGRRTGQCVRSSSELERATRPTVLSALILIGSVYSAKLCSGSDAAKTREEQKYMSTSPSACSAFLHAAWKACSTLMASFADVSKLCVHVTGVGMKRRKVNALRDVALLLTPRHGPLLTDHALSLFDIDLVADDDEREAIRVSRRRLYQELVAP